MRATSLVLTGLALVAWTGAASADLYRWRDPDSGSIKITSQAPPWHGEGAKTQTGPAVEVIRSALVPGAGAARPAAAMGVPGAMGVPAANPAAAPRAVAPPAKPEAAPAKAGGAAQAAPKSVIEALEAKRKELLRIFDAFPKATDFNSAAGGFGNHLQAYEAVAAELDRIDPKRAAARKAEEPSMLEKFRAGMRFQLLPTPALPGQPQK